MLEKTLINIEKRLGEMDKKKVNTENAKLSDQDIFNNSILPQVQRKIKEIEDM